ncbi:MAG: DUF2599 domain-containing protein [Bifidobacterium tibiigranuli]|jgi:hypothetical protein|uniref:DUF2599 domain-containing protein n=1 Tax=Bifidobacterium tibiigranuli TaxID=2172043 RepID=UPI0023574D84|nr:DUF2599 domain-containing protein [Bifidobacterium tibiigranuli]MCH3975513.1 DUF2599 domain-containing protein [Bifidobacterium tibiigranuli]MCH4204128.1 DUF2599 domain-containing protein [Bifidobacterium tibiigranuli]MCH4274675.1 DUF2599 domain-containing protein [Bifidobacterium tibiigranuli]MCI1649372.1 DUF2599 domain-containing protein [Bifidobacterium tibiigranuli]MCI1672982.1 DUF2599 domain-containing protein [Bifidobacterium tibiigranuli]
MKTHKKWLLLASVITVSLMLPTITANAAEPSPQTQYDSDLVENLSPNPTDNTASLHYANGSYQADAGQTQVSIPQDSSQPVTFTDDSSAAGLAMKATGDDFTNGTYTENQTVVHSGTDASTGVQAIDGGVQQVFYLNNAQASHKYTVDYSSPDLDHMAFSKDKTGNTDGSVTLYKDKAETQILAYVPAPWAKDATGREVSTHYEIQDNSLVQVIQPTRNDTYPIVADPTTISTFFSSWKWIYRSPYWSLSLVPNGWLRAAGGPTGAMTEIVARQSWNQVYAHEHNNSHWKNKNVNGMFNQYECHFHFAFWKSAFNLEPARPNPGLAKTIAAVCNPR